MRKVVTSLFSFFVIGLLLFGCGCPQPMVPEQPIDEAKDLRLDKMTAAEFIRPYGPELKGFLDSYAQSALGAATDHLNALAFCNF